MRSDSHLIWLCVSCWFPWLRHSVFHIFGWSRWKNRTPQIPAAIPWESYTWVSARWFSASPCCTISELCGVGSLSPRRLAQRSVHPGNLLTVGYHHIAFSKINSKCFRTGDCRVGSTPTICAISVVESKDFTTDIFVYGFEMWCCKFTQWLLQAKIHLQQ